MVRPAMLSIVRRRRGACHRAALRADPLAAPHHEGRRNSGPFKSLSDGTSEFALKRWLPAVVLLVCLVGPAHAGLDAASVNTADWKGKAPPRDKLDPAIVRLQVLLDRAGFSPGEIDGKLGENAVKALRAFAEARSLAFDGRTPTAEIWNALVATSSDPVIIDYKVAEKDVKGPFLQKLPAKMEDMQGLKSLDYSSPREAIAEIGRA